MGRETLGYSLPASTSGNYGMAVQRVREALEEHDCRPRGCGKLRARCPLHESTTMPLSVSQGRVGALIHCFSGCDEREILAAIGLCWDDMFDEPRDRTRPLPRRPPNPLGDLTEGERRFLRALDAMPVFRLWDGQMFAHLVANWTGPGDWEARVQATEDDCETAAEAHYWRFMARCSALATDEVYVRGAYRLRETHPVLMTPEQCEVLRMRTEDLARVAALVTGNESHGRAT